MSKKKILTLVTLFAVAVACTSVCLVSSYKKTKAFKLEVGVYDPISNLFLSQHKNALTIPNVKESSTPITVIGQIAYKYSSLGSDVQNTIILQDVVQKEIVGITVVDDQHRYRIGNVVAVTGTVSKENNTLVINDVTNVKRLKEERKFKPQKLSISELSLDKDKYMSEYIMLEDVTLGAYNAESGTASLSDGTGTIVVNTPAYPTSLNEGCHANVSGVLNNYPSENTLYIGSSKDYKETDMKNVKYYDTTKKVQIASFSGKSNLIANVIYADVTPGDFSNTNSYIYASNGNIAVVDKTSLAPCLGTKGMIGKQFFGIYFNSFKNGNLNIKFDISVTEDAPKYYVVQGSSNGILFKDIAKIELKDVDKYNTIELGLPSWMNNSFQSSIRLVATNKDFNGNAPSKKNIVKLSNITITGSPSISNMVCDIVEYDQQGNSLPKGTQLKLSCKDENAKIYYSINNSNFELYDKNKPPRLLKFPAVVRAYSDKATALKSPITTKTFVEGDEKSESTSDFLLDYVNTDISNEGK